MKRATIALGIVAILASSCGGGELSTRLATSLENRVASIRGYAESGRPGLARSAVRNLVELVTAQVEAGRIDEGRATEILAAAEAVAEQLALLPRTAPTESPTRARRRSTRATRVDTETVTARTRTRDTATRATGTTTDRLAR